MSMTVVEHGDFDALLRFFDAQRMKASLNQLREEMLQKLAELYVARVKEAIETGDVGGPGLRPSTIEKKRRTGARAPGQPWIDKEDLLRSITARKLHDGVWHGGVPPNVKNRRGQPLDLIALIAEIGSIRQAARPVFEPQARKLEENGAEGIDADRLVIEAFGLA